MKAKKLNRIILSFALSAALLAEPLAAMPAVYAKEMQTAAEETIGTNEKKENRQGTDGASAGGSTKENLKEGVQYGTAGTDSVKEGREDAAVEDSIEEGRDDATVEDSKEDDSEGTTGDNVDGSTGENPKEEPDDTTGGGTAGEEPDNTTGGNPDGEGPDDTIGGNPDREEPDDTAGEGSDGEEPDDTAGGNTGEEDPEGTTGGDSDEEGPDDTTGEDPEEELEGTTGEDETEETADLEENGEGTEDSEGFSDMPADYRLTSFQKEQKAELAKELRKLDESEEGETYVEREVITFAESSEEAEQIAQGYRAEIVSFEMGVLTLRISEGKSVKSALRAAADMSNNLPAVWPNYYRFLYWETETEASGLEVTEEEYFVSEDGEPGGNETNTGEEITLEAYEQAFDAWEDYDPYLNPAETSYQWFHTTIGSTYAWDEGYMGEGVKVGVIDSGVDSNEDLSGNVFGAMDFCDGTADAADAIGHGTHVAGTIAALQNGSYGMGVAPRAQIFNARVFGKDASKSGADATIIKAIGYLISEDGNLSNPEINDNQPRVDIINMSLGGPGESGAFQNVLNKAYKKGVIVFAATGNDGGVQEMFPAGYDHVIGVSATDNNNQRAYFSNYGTATDLSAPGVDIYATYGSGYRSMKGTSMACPVAAGTAAVILSGRDSLSSLKTQNGYKTGSARVNAVESIMKNNAISAGSGMGKGITSLPKVFKLSTAAAKPNAPDISITPSEDRQSVTVTIQAQAGMKICYTTNGKNPVYQSGMPENEMSDNGTTLTGGNTVTFTIDCSKAAKGTIKAFALNESGMAGAVKSKTYTLSPYVSVITVSGPAKVERGKNIQLTATVLPSYASNKGVTWTLRTLAGDDVDPAKVKIDAKGKVTATKEADPGRYQVIVQAKDQGKAAAEPFEIEVTKEGTSLQSLSFDKKMNKQLWLVQGDESPVLDLRDGLIAREKNAEGILTQLGKDALDGRVLWTSSKPAVATVDRSGKVTAIAVGTTTITAMANDSSKKKATVAVTVKQAVTGITITTAKGGTQAGQFSVAAGKSMALKAAVSPAKPANKKVVWSIDSGTSDVTINPSTGRITVKSGAASAVYTVTATAADNKGAMATQQIKVYGGAIGTIELDVTKVSLYTTAVDADKTNTKTIMATLKGANGREDFDPDAYAVTSSNEAVVKASAVTAEDGRIAITLTAAGEKYGKANVVIAATDGSNKKKTCAVTVSGGITRVALQDEKQKNVSKLNLFRDGTISSAPAAARLYAVIQGSEGANKSAYDVTSSNPSLVKVQLDRQTGEITLTAGRKGTGKATITLSTSDGSRKKAVCTVTVSNPPSRINVAPKNGIAAYLSPGKSIQLTATMETEYGAVSDRKVTWSLEDKYAAMGITINPSTGKVSIPAEMKVSKPGYFEVKAAAANGSGVSGIGKVYLVPPTTHITVTKDDWKHGLVYFKSDCAAPMTCTSSAPEVASAQLVYTQYNPSTGKGGEGYIYFVPTGDRGLVTFTVKAMDGTNITWRYTIKVV